MNADNEEYPLSSWPRGRFIIISQENYVYETDDTKLPSRDCAKIDAEIMKNLFERLGFMVDVYMDKTVEQIQKIVTELSDLEKDCLFGFFIGTHGGANGLIYGTDGPMNLSEIIDPICKKIPDKPKMFYVQACRGEIKMVTHKEDSPEVYNKEEIKINLPNHALLVRSTVEGYVSFKNRGGSWFVRGIEEVFEKHKGKRLDVVKLLTRANLKISERRSNSHLDTMQNKCQVLSISSQLLSELYLTPYETQV